MEINISKNQMTLFANPEEHEVKDLKRKMAVFFSSGGGRKKSLQRICIRLQSDLSIDQLAEELAKEYETGGKGFYFNDEPFCAFYDQSGLKFARAKSAEFEPEISIDWKEAAEDMKTMYLKGIFSNEEINESAYENEVEETAQDIVYFYREIDDNSYFNVFDKEMSLTIFPDAVLKVSEKLKTEAGFVEALRKEILSIMDTLKNEGKLSGYINNSGIRSARKLYVLQHATNYVVQHGPKPRQVDFITDDEINKTLYEFLIGQTPQESLFAKYVNGQLTHDDFIARLKHRYTYGGKYPGVIGADSSNFTYNASSGMTLEKNNSIQCKFSWPQTIKIMENYHDHLGAPLLGNLLMEVDVEESNDVAVEPSAAEYEQADSPEIPEISDQSSDAEADVSQATTFDEEADTADSDANAADEEEDTADLKVDIDDEEEDFADSDVNTTDEEVEIADSETESPLSESQEIEKEQKGRARNYEINVSANIKATPLEKIDWNIKAITTLKRLESQDRAASASEQEILSRYVGWGGLADMFDLNSKKWAKEKAELRSLLTEDEYKAAMASTLDSFYTPRSVVQAIYGYLDKIGFETGNILEPSCGIGIFFGMLPKKMRKSHNFGVELDSIPGRIAQNLYPENVIEISKFEESTVGKDFFDIVLGNCPFGDYKITDKSLSKNPFYIHDYFFARGLASLRPNGILIMLTSKGTMDKQNNKARLYLSQRADLLGAIRLPDTTFHAAGTKAVTDILFFQKREHLSYDVPSWVETGVNSEGFTINNYFIEHPQQIVGNLEEVSGPFGPQMTCSLPDDMDFEEELAKAVDNIFTVHYSVEDLDAEDEQSVEIDDTSILMADPSVKNFSFTLVDGKVYYRVNSIMKQEDCGETTHDRIVNMLALRDQVKKLIAIQMEESTTDEEIRKEQLVLNEMYDEFQEKYGLINSTSNSRAFSKDSSYYLLCSLEILDNDGNLERKSDIFNKRTINPVKTITHAKSAYDAMIASLNEHGYVNLPYMAGLCRKSEDEIIHDLKNIIFRVPFEQDETGHDLYVTAEEYLSGNVRRKLEIAKSAAESDDSFAVNVEALEKNQPKDLDASEIYIQLGSTWVDSEIFQEFFYELFQIKDNRKSYMKVLYSNLTNRWSVEGKRYAYDILSQKTYGTDRINGYEIFEHGLNLTDIRIYDIITVDDKDKRVLNSKETLLANQKLDLIKFEFSNWIFKDPARREALCRKYNDTFNAIKPREYNGSHLQFPGMNPAITLRPHQKNAVAHQLYGQNVLLAHVVGGGKTFEICAAIMESKRIGLAEKAMVVVPNHLTEQWGAEFLRLYPKANILVATKKDFQPKNRKKFCTKISLGTYDAVIIGHSQFEKIPMSVEYQKRTIEQELDEIESAMAKKNEDATVKSLARDRKKLEGKLAKLNDIQQDDVITFEELGIDRLYVDEAHHFKNAFVWTKMKNVSGISQSESLKAMDMLNKCRYMDEKTGGKGIVFATGTPVSNTMTEMFIMQRYLQADLLKEMDLNFFDSWISVFGEVVTALELSPEGTGYRSKTRLARFNNLPELISMFKLCADIKTADDLELPVPEVEYKTLVSKPSEYQRQAVQALSERAEEVRSGGVSPQQDNMLLITNDGRKLALDQRLFNSALPDYEEGKVAACAEKVYAIWAFTAKQKCTQLIFCDLSTPKENGEFNIYDDLKAKLLAKGVDEKEIAFIHDAKTEKQKETLFRQVREGKVRILIGSTGKMGAGTNIQDRLVSLHHLDIGWRPADIEQREGRIIRQGNKNRKVYIYRYITEATFDSYMWQIIENKQKFVAQIMTSKSPVRSCEDIDETVLSYAEIKALATGNPLIKEKMELDLDVSKLKLLKADYLSNHYRMENDIASKYPAQIAMVENKIMDLIEDANHYEAHRFRNENDFHITIKGNTYRDPKQAFAALMAITGNVHGGVIDDFGEYCGFSMSTEYSKLDNRWIIVFQHKATTRIDLQKIGIRNFLRFDAALNQFDKRIENMNNRLDSIKHQLEQAKQEVNKPFVKEEELKQKMQRLTEVNLLLNMDDDKSEEASNAAAV